MPIFGSLTGMFVFWLTSTLKATSGFFYTSLVIIAIPVIIWTVYGGKNWWMAFVVMASFGGVFWVGFKVYPTEIGMLLAFMALFFAMLIKGKNFKQNRKKISWAFSLLIIYFILHMLASLYIAKIGLMNGAGSIIRTYSIGMTFLLFAWFFYKFGSTKNIKNVFIIILLINSIRMGIGLYVYFFTYNPSFSEPGWIFIGMSSDLRSSALYQINMAIIIFYANKNRAIRLIILLLIVFSFFALLLGQSRVSVFAAMLTIVFWILIEKKYALSILFLSIFLSAFILINTNIKLFEYLPFEVRRSLSFMVLDKNKILSNYPFVSDEWHSDLFKFGYNRWSSSTASIFFGNYIDPSDAWRFSSFDYNIQVKIASAMARYESTLWTVLATLGIIGFSLYVCIFAFLFNDIILIVKRDGIKNFNNAVYAVGIISFLLMIILGWIRGGFPDFAIMLGMMGKALYEDSKYKNLLKRS